MIKVDETFVTAHLKSIKIHEKGYKLKFDHGIACGGSWRRFKPSCSSLTLKKKSRPFRLDRVSSPRKFLFGKKEKSFLRTLKNVVSTKWRRRPSWRPINTKSLQQQRDTLSKASGIDHFSRSTILSFIRSTREKGIDIPLLKQ